MNMNTNLNYRDLTAAETAQITAPMPKKEGAAFVKFVAVSPQNIYIRNNEKDENNNLVRKKMSIGIANAIAQSYRTQGQLLNLPIPVVKEVRPFQRSGKWYTFVGVDIHHRHIAAVQAQLDELIVAIYEFTSDESEAKFMLEANDHSPSNPVSAEDITNTLCLAVSKGWIGNIKEEMEEWISGIKHCHGNTKNKGVREAMRLCGTYSDCRTYTANDVQSFIDCDDNYADGETKYTTGGVLDDERDKLGWSVLEEYTQKYIWEAAKAYKTRGKESYFIFHTKTPTDKENLSQKRIGMLDRMKHLEEVLDSVAEYKSKNGHYPWHVEAFLPQDNINSEEGFISVKSIKSRSGSV